MERKRKRKQYDEIEEAILQENDRKAPRATEVERAIIGALINDPRCFSDISDIITADSFYDERYAIIYRTIVAMNMNNESVDLLTITDRMISDGNIDKLDGPGRGILFVTKVCAESGSSTNIIYHAKIVAKKALARNIINFATKILDEAYEETSNVEEVLRTAEGDLFKLTQSEIKSEVEHISTSVNQAIDKIEKASSREDGLSGIPSGFTALDKITSGWQNTDLIIVAARPAMGKTAFVLSMCKNIAVDYNIPVGIFSLEMSKVQLANRMLSNVCEISGDVIKSGKLTMEEWIRLSDRAGYVKNAPIFTDDTANMSVFELKSKARKLVREHGVKIIMVDYLQLMNASGMQFNSREQEVSIISRSLKGLAKELNIPIIALAQLNRGVENRQGDNKRPMLSDLRESGSIEQDADMVCFLHRPEYYKIFQDADGNDMRGIAEVIVAKHRSGSVGDVKLKFKGEYVRFQNLGGDLYGH